MSSQLDSVESDSVPVVSLFTTIRGIDNGLACLYGCGRSLSLLRREGRVGLDGDGDTKCPCVCDKATTSVSEMARSADSWTRDEDATGALSAGRMGFWVNVSGLGFVMGRLSLFASGRGSWSPQR